MFTDKLSEWCLFIRCGLHGFLIGYAFCNLFYKHLKRHNIAEFICTGHVLRLLMFEEAGICTTHISVLADSIS